MELKTRPTGRKPLAAGDTAPSVCGMKIIAVLLCSLVLAASLHAQAPGPKKAAPKTVEPAKKEEPAAIEGIVVSRGALGFLGVQIVNSTFKISFYDANKKPAKADVARALLRWDPKSRSGSERVVLNLSEDGMSLTSPKNIRPPYLFKLFITLLKDAAAGEDAAGETHVIDFRG